MSAELVGWLGLVFTVVFGVAAFFGVKNLRKNHQTQKIDRGSKGFQAGRDINIGGE